MLHSSPYGLPAVPVGSEPIAVIHKNLFRIPRSVLRLLPVAQSGRLPWVSPRDVAPRCLFWDVNPPYRRGLKSTFEEFAL